MKLYDKVDIIITTGKVNLKVNRIESLHIFFTSSSSLNCSLFFFACLLSSADSYDTATPMPSTKIGDKISPCATFCRLWGVKNSPLFLLSSVGDLFLRHGEGGVEVAAPERATEVGDDLLGVAFVACGGDDVGARKNEVTCSISTGAEARDDHVDPHGHHLGKFDALHNQRGATLSVEGEGALDVFLSKGGDAHVAHKGLGLQEKP